MLFRFFGPFLKLLWYDGSSLKAAGTLGDLSQCLNSFLRCPTYDTSTEKEENVCTHTGSELFFATELENCKATADVLRRGGQRSLRLGDCDLENK